MSKDVGRLHVITDELLQTRFSHAELAIMAAAGGADIIQYREKRPLTTRAMISAAQAMIAATRNQAAKGGVSRETPVLIDDRADIAAAVGAPALHLGRDDLPPAAARRILGPDAIIGGTANSLEEAIRVAREPIDYLGVGPVYGTTSKGDRAAPKLGLPALAEIAAAVDLPVIAIGGITVESVAEVLATGAYGVAVLSAVVCADDPQAATAAFRDAIDRALS